MNKEKLRVPTHEEIAVGGKQNDPPGGKLPSIGGNKSKEITLLRVTEIECLNYRCPTFGPAGGLSILHLSKLGWQDGNCLGPLCNHGVYKAVSETRHNGIEEVDALLPTLDFLHPVNFIFRECLKSSRIMDKISIRNSSVRTLAKALQ